VRTRLTLLASLALAVLLALPTAALAGHGGGPGHHGSTGSGSAVDHGSSDSGSGEYADTSGSGSADDADTSGSGSGGSTGTGSGHNGANDNRTADPPATRAAPTPAAPTLAAGPPVGRVADPGVEHARLSTTPTARATALTPASVAVVLAALVLAAMVVAGFRARAHLGRLG
jgi:cobalamin biosynthesis Mg chelatase CobN